VNGVDLVLAGAALTFAVLGWRIGLLRGLAAVAGVAVGAAIAFVAADLLDDALALSGLQRALVAVGAMGVTSVLAQSLLTRAVQPIHDGVEASGAAVVNRSGGALLTTAVLVVMVWAMATALALMPASPLGPLMRGSAVLVGMERLAPTDAGGLFGAFRGVAPGQAPRVFTGLGLVPPPQVPAPDDSVITAAARATARQSVVRVSGEGACGSLVSGTGVVVAPGLVVTNAHVVAGVAVPVVSSAATGTTLPASVVRFDPRLDLAVLRAERLALPPAPVGRDPLPLDVVALAGYPEGGVQQVVPGRVRGLVQATGEDIYGTDDVHRPVVIMAAAVEPGDSGGPVLDADGRVVAVVFAATVGAADQAGYALPISAVAPLLPGAATAAAQVAPPLPQDCPVR
jgi:S1-C subfamily serine protease